MGGFTGFDPARPLVVGVGAASGVAAEEVAALVREALARAGRPLTEVAALTTVESRLAEPGLVAAARLLGLPLTAYGAGRLARVPVPHPSEAVRAAAGTASVAEAAALAGGGQLLVPKRRSARATCAVAEHGPDLRHHGDTEVREAGLVDLAVNVRAGTPPAWLRERIADSLGALAAYPDGRAARAAVAARHGVAPERVLLTAGAAEAFVLLARAVRTVRPVVVHPQFTEPEAALRDAGRTVGRVVLSADDGFRLDPSAVPEDADLVVLGNPTNPTSVLHPAEAVAALARPGRTLVVDEAFMDVVPGERESLAGRQDVPGLVVLRSLTKTWGLAGLRVGYAVGPPELMAALGRAQPLWPVSTPALVAAEACVSPPALAEAERAAVRVVADRAYLVAGLGRFAGRGLAVVGPAAGSFVLVRVPGAAGVRARLRAAGFAVRRGDTFPGLGPQWLRIAVRGHRVTDAFLSAVDAALPTR